ncbi:phosphotyrosine protein phosphatase [Methylacidiphilum kamchatkense Kam1]|uniref:Arsenate reductase n=1 Tax=Methylacidiphilum kamchatkense Kam1 TaxID=1202785 RepID=A0A0C1V636_9BACT|nr:arsenate reductase ArsC [Methylacidiphilum kamchatkense]KIE59200.1 phosphotyrosine protein phosphatase [Methylacidiphilum kamchatkense Kam1]QDQ42840.1 arsenate reductase [Methylacidiphilum kamchatkense Kam1]
MMLPLHVLFLCTGNSARSIMAEAILNHYSGGRFHAYSAGSRPKGLVHPLALETLQFHGISIDGLRSKPLTEFLQANAPAIDYVVTVCSSAAKEACPLFPKKAIIEHWDLPDPAAVEGDIGKQKEAFQKIFDALHQRIFLYFLSR